MVDGQQQQKTTSASVVIREEQESEVQWAQGHQNWTCIIGYDLAEYVCTISRLFFHTIIKNTLFPGNVISTVQKDETCFLKVPTFPSSRSFCHGCKSSLKELTSSVPTEERRRNEKKE